MGPQRGNGEKGAAVRVRRGLCFLFRATRPELLGTGLGAMTSVRLARRRGTLGCGGVHPFRPGVAVRLATRLHGNREARPHRGTSATLHA